jgi:hypothetical protein
MVKKSIDLEGIHKKPGEKLSRYTNFPVLIDLLLRKKLVLLSPDSWDDRNDAEVMLEYKKRKKLKHLYAACFSEGDETIHHWIAYSNGSSGCCIEFDRKQILSAVRDIPEIRKGSVVSRAMVYPH